MFKIISRKGLNNSSILLTINLHRWHKFNDCAVPAQVLNIMTDYKWRTLPSVLTFHPPLEEMVVIVDQIEHSDDFRESVAESVELAEDVVFREVERDLIGQERLRLDQLVRALVDAVEAYAVLQLLADFLPSLSPNRFLAPLRDIMLACLYHLIRYLRTFY